MAGHSDGTILLNGIVFEILPSSMRVTPQATAPRIVNGLPSGGEASEDSVVGWDDWQDGGFEVTYKNPARVSTAKDVITDIPHQLTLSMLQQATTGVDEAPTKIAQLRAGDRMTAISATEVWLKDAAGEAWTAKLTGVTPTDLIAWGDGTDTLWLVGMGNATAYRYTTDITATPVTWTVSNLGAGGDAQYANFWASGSAGTGGSGGTLWKAVKPNKVYASANPKNGGAWTSAYTVGGSETNITGMAVIEDRLIVAKEDGIYWVQPAGTVQLLIDLKGAVDATSGKQMVAWGGYIFLNWVQGLFQLSGRNLLNVGEVTGSFRDIGPHVANQEAGDVRGRVVALLGAPTRLYAVLANESGNYSISRYNGDPRPGYGWNPGFLWLGASACNALGWEQPTTGNPRLYFGYGAGIRYVLLPLYGDNPLLDSACRFASTGTVEMAEYEGAPFRAMSKAMLYDALDLDRTSASARYVDIAYKLDDDGVIGWSTLGRFETDGLSKKYFSTTETGRRIKLQLTLGTTASTNTPRVRLLEHHFEFRPTRRRVWNFQVKAAQTRTNTTKTAKAIRDDLVAAGDSVQPVSFEDRFGTLWDCFVTQVLEQEWAKLPGAPEPQEVIGVTLHEFKSGVGASYCDSESAIVGVSYAA